MSIAKAITILPIILIGWTLGRSLNHRSGKIVGGVGVNVTSVPYIAAIEFFGRFECPAAIISTRWLATSGVCMDLMDAESSVVRTGATEYETGGHLWPVESIVTHPDQDLTLVQLGLDIVENVFTKTIKISDSEPSPGSLATVSGWGAVAEGSIMHRGLLSVSLPIISRTVCNQHLSAVDEMSICTLREGAGPCDDDEGDPLVVGGQLVGIKSWVLQEQCGNPDRPSLYVNLANPLIRDFIRNTTGI